MTLPQLHRHNPVHASRAFSLWLDFFRWTAALLVLFTHVERTILIPITDLLPSQRSLAYYAFAFVSGFGHQAVMIFFVLSGYLVGGGLWRESQKEHDINLGRYLINRISRMGVVVYPSLLVIIILNFLGIYLCHGVSSGIYTQDIFSNMSTKTLACNIAFLQTTVCEKYGNDGALWSLYNEFWYYIVWPIILLGFVTRNTRKRAGLLTIATVALIGMTVIQRDTYADFGPYMFIWLLGVGIAMRRRAIISSLWLASSLVVFALLLQRIMVRQAFSQQHPLANFCMDFALSLLFANMLITMKHHPGLQEPAGGKWHMKIAAFSFSLYCLHMPILSLYSAYLNYHFHTGWNMIPTRVQDWLVVLGGIVLCLFMSFLFSLGTEAHTTRVRDWLSHRVSDHAPLESTANRFVRIMMND